MPKFRRLALIRNTGVAVKSNGAVGNVEVVVYKFPTATGALRCWLRYGNSSKTAGTSMESQRSERGGGGGSPAGKSGGASSNDGTATPGGGGAGGGSCSTGGGGCRYCA